MVQVSLSPRHKYGWFRAPTHLQNEGNPVAHALMCHLSPVPDHYTSTQVADMSGLRSYRG